MTRGVQLDADGVRALFHELSDRLAAEGVSAQLFVVGGAAMALAYDRVPEQRHPTHGATGPVRAL